VRPLVERLAAAFGERRDWEVLFVDDDSKDGTAAAVEALAPRFPARVIVRQGERGLASAVVRGIESAAAPVVVVMDADLQHPPETAPRLARAVEEGADVAIGSRYVAGGGTPGWSRLRRLMSGFAGSLARGLTTARDPMSGFFALKPRVLDGVTLRVRGFKILLEILARARPERVVEVPIEFTPRLAGESKLGAGVTLDYLKQLARLYAVRPAAQVAGFVIAATLVKCVLACLSEPTNLEAYHWLYSRHLAAGYYDHPPMIGWWIAASTALFGDGRLGLRLVTILASGLTVGFTFLAARRLEDERTARLAALLVGLVPLTLLHGMLAAPDAPLLLFTAATLWAVVHALSGDRPAWWYAAGAFLGLALLS
jgi:hypothetical protein